MQHFAAIFTNNLYPLLKRMQDKQDIYFYSNFCQYCKDVMNIMKKHNIHNNFVIVCVDNTKYKLPGFIDRVPCILKKNGEVLTDENLYDYINTRQQVIEPSKKNENIPGLKKEEDTISPMLSLYGNSIYSTNFSTINENENEDNPNFFTLGKEENIISVTPETSSKKNDKSDSAKALEKLMESRQSDDTLIKHKLGILDKKNI